MFSFGPQVLLGIEGLGMHDDELSRAGGGEPLNARPARPARSFVLPDKKRMAPRPTTLRGHR